MKIGKNCIISNNCIIDDSAVIGHNCIIDDGVYLSSGVNIENNVIIRSNVSIGKCSYIGSNCIIGEYGHYDSIGKFSLSIGENAYIRSGSILYNGSQIGNNFSTGHQVTIRENTRIGNNVNIGTLSDIQGNCDVGHYSRLHSNVHIGQLSKIDSFVWIFPYVVLTNDPTPPSEDFIGVRVKSFAIVASSSTIMPGIEVGQDSLIGAGAVVTKNVNDYSVVVGNPAKCAGDIREIENKVTGEKVYPWRNYFKKYMPWSDSTFNDWFSRLTEQEKAFYNFDGLDFCDN